jgi:hypothetical protein
MRAAPEGLPSAHPIARSGGSRAAGMHGVLLRGSGAARVALFSGPQRRTGQIGCESRGKS